jgi:hypothetical protein
MKTTLRLASPVLTPATAKSRIMDSAAPFTRGIFRDTREQAESLFSALVADGAQITLIDSAEKKDIQPDTGAVSIRQFLTVHACGHSFPFVLVHCLCDTGKPNAYGDLCFYPTGG